MAVFTAIEVKSATGRASKEQKNFIKRIHDCGGIAGVARSLDDAESIVNLYINEKKISILLIVFNSERTRAQ